MRPKLLDELDQQGFVEVSKEQIEKYLKIDEVNGSIYLSIDIDEGKYKKSTICLGLTIEYDTKKEIRYIRTSDEYYYNKELKIYFDGNIINQISNGKDFSDFSQYNHEDIYAKYRGIIIENNTCKT